MFFTKPDTTPCLLGVYRIERRRMSFHTVKRPFHVISYRFTGEAELTCRGKVFRIRRGDLLYLPAGLEYNQSTGGERLIAVHFDLPHVAGHEAELLMPADTGTFDNLFAMLCREWETGGCGYRHRCASMLYRILSLVETRCAGTAAPGGPAGRIERSIDEMRRSFTDASLTVEALAARSGLSAVRFRALFREVYGAPPSQVLSQLRLARAKDLLLSGYYSVAQAAEKSGFGDVRYFSTRFKSATGMTPSQFRRAGG